MATQSAVFSFALPEDEDSDQLLIEESSTEAGTYSTVDTVTYTYGTTSHEFDSLDDTKWYKIQFNNSTDSEAGPISEAVYGGTFSNASPLLVVSTGTDGANYATTQNVYDYSGLTTSDVTQSRVSQALRRARAIIDLKTADLNLDRFTKTFNTKTSRKKFNATLRILKEAEINIALGNVYRGLSDDLVIKNLREASGETAQDASSVTLGQSSIGEAGGLGNTQHMGDLNALAIRYLSVGSAMLSSLQPSSIRLHSQPDDVNQSPRFKLPFNGV